MFESLIKTLMQTRRPNEEAGRRFQSRLYFPGKREQPWKRIAEHSSVRVRAHPSERWRGVCTAVEVQELLSGQWPGTSWKKAWGEGREP